ncbi:MAG: adenylyltransferase/cytidyltransferase family protein [Microbacteriaceae bacterium]
MSVKHSASRACRALILSYLSLYKSVIIGYTTGVFDMFHVGHLRLLKRAAELCDQLIVGVNTDELSAEYKGKRPIVPFDERCEIVAAISYVNRVIPQAQLDKLTAWQTIQFDRIFVGSDWQGSDRWNATEQQLIPLGVEVMYLPYTTHISSSKLRLVVNRTESV